MDNRPNFCEDSGIHCSLPSSPMSTSPCHHSSPMVTATTDLHESSSSPAQLQQLPLIHRKSSLVKEQQTNSLNEKTSKISHHQNEDDAGGGGDGDEDDPYKPPDGGWGWMVVLASFLCNLVVDGIIFSFGLFLQDLVKSFNQNKGTVAWIGSLQAGCYLVVGPIVSGLANRYGCRIVTIVGSFIAAIGFIASYFANSVYYLMITYGVIGGIGFGWIYLPAIVTVGYYFDTKRAFATGIAVCGSGIGTFVMPLLITKLLAHFHWNTCFLILSGLIMTCTIFGSFFKPLHPRKSSRSVTSSYANSENTWNGKDELNSEPGTVKSNCNSSAPPSYSTVVAMDAKFAALPMRLSMPDIRRSDEQFNSESIYKRTRTIAELTSVVKSSQTSLVSMFKRQFNYDLLDKQPFNSDMDDPCSVSVKEDATGQLIDHHLIEEEEEQEESLQVNSVANCQAIEMSRKSRSIKSPAAEYNLVDSCKKLDQMSQVTDEGVEEDGDDESTSNLLASFDPELLTSPSFLILALSGFLTLAGFFVPFIVIIEQAVSLGYDRNDACVLLSIIGVTNTIGRIFCGWISDQPKVNALFVNNISLIIGGAATILAPIFCKDFTSLAAYGSIFGFSIACFAALRSVITVDLLGKDKLITAFGLLLLPQGVATIIGSPFAGWLSEASGSNSISFYVAGSFMLVSGVMCLPLKQISIWENLRKGQALEKLSNA